MRTKGFIVIQSLVFASIAIVIMGGLVMWAGTNIKLAKRASYREQAMQIAEAGVDYYRWHLAHAPQDFQDGTGQPGPYTHDFVDKDGVVIGNFVLEITPPAVGSTIVEIRSTGNVLADPSVSRTVESLLAIASFAKFAFVSSSDMRFGEGTEVFGPIHSNGGIRFDGLAHNVVSSAVASYNDPDSDDCNNNNSFGVHTCVNPDDPSPPASVPSRPDVFEAGRQFPVPAVDFVGIASDLAQIKTDAQANGRYFAPSGALGYRILFNNVANGADTFSVYRVNSLRSTPSGCSNSQNQSGWGVWSIGTSGGAQTIIGTYSIPANGLIFVEDHAWVEGTISNSRVTVASGKFPDNPSTRTSITINNDLNYTNTNGQDVIALIAQNNINVGLYSDDTLDIDAALIAQNGRVGRYYYGTSCESSGSGNEWRRNTINLYGMIGTYGRYGFTYTGSNYDCGANDIGSGYCTRNISYDANLLYGPPPSFPLTSDQYEILSWEEVE